MSLRADDADTVPIRVDWLEPNTLREGLPGRLGLTILPGKHGASLRYPGRVYEREIEQDLAALAAAGVRLLLLLVEDAELERWGDPRIVERAAAQGIDVDRRPMPDGGPPASVSEAESILAAVARGRKHGDVAVACMGGVGRTGTVAACALIASGWDADEAVAEVRRTRHPTAVETDAQVAFVHAFASEVARRSGIR